MRLRSAWLKFSIVVIGLLGVTEVAVRLTGLTDFPAYAVDSQIGYIVKPNQAGRFLNKNAWAFNDKSMPTDVAWAPNERPNIMLIGNSIVMGGNPLDQKDKLAPQMSREMGPAYAVWPLGIGGWTTVNEMVYLQRNPEVANATKFFIWEYMAGGLSGLSEWRGDYIFPRRRPVWATWYAVRRYILPRFLSLSTNELPPTGAAVSDHLAQFDASVGMLGKISGLTHPGVIFLYPEKKDLVQARKSGEWLPERRNLEEVSARYGVTLIDVSKDPRWTESLYRDGTHPTPQGNIVLARILADAARATLHSDGL